MYFPQTFLKAGKICQLNFLANRYGLSFSVTLGNLNLKPKRLLPTTTILTGLLILTYILLVGYNQQKDAMQVNLREVYVGN